MIGKDGMIADRFHVQAYGSFGMISDGTDSPCSVAELRSRLLLVWDRKGVGRVTVWDSVIEQHYELLDRSEINGLCQRLDVP